MPAKHILHQNAQIQHPKFGCGTVVSYDERYIVIRFDDYGEKKFVASMVLPALKAIDREPPRLKGKTGRSRRSRTKAAGA